jgi:ADP-heptose:LPS heptosyltransferase
MQVTRFLVHQLLGSGLLTAEEKKRFEKALALASSRGFDCPHSNRILLGPGAGSRSKRWPLDSFLRLAGLLLQKDFRPNFLLGPLEADIEVQLADQFHSPFPVIKSGSLTDLSERLKTAAGYIGNDSAVGHLAAFLGRPTVIVFGASNSDRWAPFGRAVGIVRAEMGGRSCGLEKSADRDYHECLQSISPERVRDVFVEVYNRCKKSET